MSTTKKLILTGLGVSAGQASGKVCLVFEEADFGKVQEGDILVTKITDPGMTMIIDKCAGIVCDIGGMTSHPAIISRELGVPCVVGTKTATKVLLDGMKIFLDGTRGEIYGV